MPAAGELEVFPVRDEAGLWEFMRLPWRIYQGDPYWVPPVLSHQREFLDSKRGSFFEIGEVRYFLASRHGRPVGRISAHVNRLHDQYHGPDAGFFGFFECTRDQEAAAALFEAAAAWLRERGKTRLLGPLNFSIYDEMGLLVEGFDSMPTIFQTHNPPYYLEMLTSLGFVKAMDWHAYKITSREANLAALERRLDDILAGQNIQVITYNAKELDQRAEEVYHLFNDAWEPLWGHVPLTRRQFREMLDMIKPLLRPELAHILVEGDRMVGFGIGLPDLNPLIRKLNGELSLWGKLQLLYWAKYRPIRKVRAMVIGISQPYQGRRLHLALFLRSYLYLVKHTPCEFADFSLIPENVRPWIKVLRAFGAQRYKVFRVLEKPI